MDQSLGIFSLHQQFQGLSGKIEGLEILLAHPYRFA